MAEIKIIGGSYKNSKIQFIDSEGLRPTPNRLRETLFNWLQFELTDKIVLDLFAGSGALGFEASSRNTKIVTLIEKNKITYQSLQKNQKKHQFKNLNILHNDGFDYLKTKPKFDILFCDPPFNKDYIPKLIKILNEVQKCLIYFESEYKITQQHLPNNWQIIKEKKVSSVYATLIKI
jgi:16S rRNA (guanine966-N2)-methyltransferase